MAPHVENLMSLMLLAAALAADSPAAVLWVGSDEVVPPGATFVVVRAKAGGVEALDLATGKPLWTNTDADRPAGGSDKVVLAWTEEAKKPNMFRVVAVDAATGKTLAKSDPVVMPDWVTTARVWGWKFGAAARVDGDTAVVAWQASAFYAGGPRPSPEMEQAAAKAAAGLAVADLKTGKVTAKAGEPKDADFGVCGYKVGGLELVVREVEVTDPSRVTLTVSKGGRELWKRELAGNPATGRGRP
jgi:hypothetical protein